MLFLAPTAQCSLERAGLTSSRTDPAVGAQLLHASANRLGKGGGIIHPRSMPMCEDSP